MSYILPVLLTILCIWFTIVLVEKIKKRILVVNKYRQSDIHKILKPFYSAKQHNVNKQTQIDKMLEKSSINVMIMDNRAYWVFKNTFYTADFVNGDVDPETTQVVDTSSMSKEDMEKMFFILDKLGDGNSNDSGSTR